MRIYSFIFLIFIANKSLKADIVEYVFLHWDCSEKLLLEEKIVTEDTRFEKQLDISLRKPNKCFVN